MTGCDAGVCTVCFLEELDQTLKRFNLELICNKETSLELGSFLMQGKVRLRQGVSPDH